MKIAVTGGAGFIGNEVVKELRARGDEPVILDTRDGCDVRNQNSVFDHLSGVDHVIHLAGVLGTAELFERVGDAVDVNIVGTVNVLDACRAYGLGYTGISMPPVFPSVYTATKTCAVTLASAYHQAHKIPVSHVIAYNAYGPRQKWGPAHPRKIIPHFAVMAHQGKPLGVWGSGEQTVDLVRVEDLARMLVDACAFGGDQTFDGGTGQALSVNQVAETVIDMAESKSTIVHEPMRKGEVETNIVAEGEGWDLLGWQPMLDLPALAKTVKWYARYADEAAA